MSTTIEAAFDAIITRLDFAEQCPGPGRHDSPIILDCVELRFDYRERHAGESQEATKAILAAFERKKSVRVTVSWEEA